MKALAFKSLFSTQFKMADLVQQKFLLSMNREMRGNILILFLDRFYFQTKWFKSNLQKHEHLNFQGSQRTPKLTQGIYCYLLHSGCQIFTTFCFIWFYEMPARRKLRKPTYNRCLPTISTRFQRMFLKFCLLCCSTSEVKLSK